MSWLPIIITIIVLLVVIFIVSRFMRVVKIKKEQQMRADIYGKQSALQRFTEDEYFEIISVGMFFSSEHNRCMTLFHNNEMTEQEYYDEMTAASHKGNKIREKYKLSSREMSEYYIFSEYYIPTMK